MLVWGVLRDAVLAEDLAQDALVSARPCRSAFPVMLAIGSVPGTDIQGDLSPGGTAREKSARVGMNRR